MSKINEIKEKLKKLDLKVNPSLSKEEMEFFEKYLHIKLPNEYKQFLTEIGNGGAGPCQGVLPLDKWNDAVDGPPLDEFYMESPEVGAITICDQGCTFYTLLVVCGEHVGKIVNFDKQTRKVSFSEYNTFFDWYLAWLDGELGGKK